MPQPAGTQRERVIGHVTRRLIPFAFICYVVAYIDRVNIGFAATQLQRDLRLSATEFGLGAGLFFLGYCLFEIPSNLILERVGARRWIARIMIAWGLVSMGTVFISDAWSFMAARVVLGIAEAGFFPGVVLYLTYWIPAAERARTNALFMMAAPVAVIVGAPLSEALLTLEGAIRPARVAMAVPAGRAAGSRAGRDRLAGVDRPPRTGGVAASGRSRLVVADDGRGACVASRDRTRCHRAEPEERTRVAAVRRVLPEHQRHVRHLPVAPPDPGGGLRRGRISPEPVDRRPVRCRPRRDGADRAALRSHWRAQAARGGVRADGGERPAARRGVQRHTCRSSS